MTGTTVSVSKNGALVEVSSADVFQEYVDQIVALIARFDQQISAAAASSAALNSGRLRQTHVDLFRIERGENVQHITAIIGDSYSTSPTYYSQSLGDDLVESYGNAGPGYTGLGFTGAYPSDYTLNLNARPNQYGVTISGSGWTSSYHVGAMTPDLAYITSSTVGDKITYTFSATPTANSVRLYTAPPFTGAVEYRYGSGSWVPITLTSAGSTPEVFTLSGHPTSGSWTLEVRVASGSPRLAGIYPLTLAAGEVVHKLGSSGSQAQDWAAVVGGSDWRSGFGTLDPHLVIIMLGANDRAAGRSPAVFKSDVGTIVTAVKTEVPSADILIIAQPENATTGSVKMKDYATALADLATEQNVAFLNLQPLYGSPDSVGEYADGGAYPMLLPDGLHPKPTTGGRTIAWAIRETLKRI